MGWPNMEFSTPTTASHALVSAEAEEEIQRQFKRRKLVSEDASMAVDDPVTAPSSTAAASVFSNPTSTASQTAATTGMEVDPTPSVSSSTSTLSCSTQAQQQQQQQQQQRHNGNSWTDEELVYQVLESGAQTQSEVIQFCVSRGVPISRVLQMDLVRRLSFLRTGC